MHIPEKLSSVIMHVKQLVTVLAGYSSRPSLTNHTLTSHSQSAGQDEYLVGGRICSENNQEFDENNFGLVQ